MTAPWKIALDHTLIHSEVEVWTTGALWNEALSPAQPPSRPTFERWISEAVAAGKLKKIRAGIFVNAAGNANVSPAAAAGLIRRSAIPSLSWVLEQNWILNNFGDVITCTVPMAAGLQVPSLSAVKTAYATFQFRALPWGLHELDALPVEDWRDNRFAHPRATPEKALCDWLYLGRSPRSSLRAPPLDLDYERFNKARLRRIVGAMRIGNAFESWLQKKVEYEQDPEVQANTSLRGMQQKE
jgi:hypothetical protein